MFDPIFWLVVIVAAVSGFGWFYYSIEMDWQRMTNCLVAMLGAAFIAIGILIAG